VHDIIAEAVRQRASDIHIEPLARRLRVRYRIDGVLAEAEAPPVRLQSAIISRLKLMANISIAEKRVPQDGRIQLTVSGRALDLRVSSLPTVHGEGIVMRLLDKEALRTGLADLGLEAGDDEVFHRLINAPDGMMLVTGPTGSGKTTTLYSCLHHLNQSDRKIITVEDPVEYQLAGVNQVPVRAETGMTFAAALRAMLRQAPNIVMVGEIRDRETAEISINAALTGHLVFSTLHTNDAPGAVARLLDLGVKPFLLASALRAVVAQRLVRRICPECRENYVPSAPELHLAGLPASAAETVRLARGTGCPACHGTGYRGRLGIFEIFLMSDAIRRMIYEHASAARLRARAREDGMHTMREDGIRKVLAGHTTINEVVSVTVGDID
jgi:general secretion pathway protein E/type IV pilus assembly protein PilB